MPYHGPPEDPHGLGQLSALPVNRGLKPWDYELSDPSWRRWFDALKEQGVENLGDTAVGALKGMWGLPGAAPEGLMGAATGGYASGYPASNSLTAGSDELYGLVQQGKTPRRAPRGAAGRVRGAFNALQQAMPESHESFMKRYGR